jgi:CRP/FNR family transcriptional regulator
MQHDKLYTFLEHYPVRKFAKGEIILVQGEVPKSAYIVKKGVIKTYNLTSQGEEKPISFDIRGEMFPVAWIFSKAKYSQYYYEAFTDCEVYAVPPQEYIDLLQRDQEILFDVFSFFIGRHVNYQMRVNALEQSKASAKVLHTIHFLALRFGRDLRNNLVEIQLPFTQQDLANFMGLTRETTGIELKKLQREGVLTYRRQRYVVHTDKLDGLLDDEYDQGRVMEDQAVLSAIKDATP